MTLDLHSHLSDLSSDLKTLNPEAIDTAMLRLFTAARGYIGWRLIVGVFRIRWAEVLEGGDL